MKDIIIFHLRTNIFAAMKYCCILHGFVFVMMGLKIIYKSQTYSDSAIFQVNRDDTSVTFTSNHAIL